MNVKMKLTGLFLLTLGILNSQLSTAHAQGTAFTYQGRLNSGGSPASGVYDYRFKLYSDALGNTQVGSSYLTNGIGVTNGLFVTTIDFGAGIFTGANYWLEVDVRTNGAGGYTTLAPLQAVAPTPYAVFAGSASNVLGTLPVSQLPTSVVTNNATGLTLNGSFTGNGANVTNVNAATLNGLTAASFWKLGGNNVLPGQVLGSTNGQPLQLVANGSPILRLVPDGTSWGSPIIIGGSSANYAASGALGSFIGGGGATNYFGNPPQGNSVYGWFGVVVGGVANTNYATAGTIGGGYQNQIGDAGSIVHAQVATVGGGQNNWADAYVSTVAGGTGNLTTGPGSFIGGGGLGQNYGTWGNTASGFDSVVGGGVHNTASGTNTSISGGQQNTASGDYATVGGGYGNMSSGNGAFVGGGGYTGFNYYGNVAAGTAATIVGGIGNSASGIGAFIGGGGYDGSYLQANTASGNASVIGGGVANQATNGYSVVGGGYGNISGGYESFVGAGYGNIASGQNSFIGGGINNGASAFSAVVGGGSGNLASGSYAVVGGGNGNTASAPYAVVPGGDGNTAIASYSFAAGNNASARTAGTFVWSDSLTNLFDPYAQAGSIGIQNSFNVRSTGGFYIVTGVNPTNGAVTAETYLAPGSTAWATLSDRNVKKDFAPVDYLAVLDKLTGVPIQQWHYKWENGDVDPNIGPMAQDFKHAFYPDRDDKSITTLEFDGVELAAIQGLNEKIEARSQKLEAENAELKAQLAELKTLVQQLAQPK